MPNTHTQKTNCELVHKHMSTFKTKEDWRRCSRNEEQTTKPRRRRTRDPVSARSAPSSEFNPEAWPSLLLLLPSSHRTTIWTEQPVYLIKHSLHVSPSTTSPSSSSSPNTRCTYLVMFKSLLCSPCCLGRTLTIGKER